MPSSRATADSYSRWVTGHQGGESETIIGKWFRQSGKRNRVVLATKVGKPMGDDDKGLSKAYIRRAVEASLRRLKTEVIDLYQSHDDDAATPLEVDLCLPGHGPPFRDPEAKIAEADASP